MKPSLPYSGEQTQEVSELLDSIYSLHQNTKQHLYSSTHNKQLQLEGNCFIEESGKIFSYRSSTGELHWTDLETGTPGAQAIPYFAFKRYCSWCEVPGGSLMITGGHPPTNEVHRIDLRRDYSVSIKPQMITSRLAHNSAYYNEALYVIGGW